MQQPQQLLYKKLDLFKVSLAFYGLATLFTHSEQIKLLPHYAEHRLAFGYRKSPNNISTTMHGFGVSGWMPFLARTRSTVFPSYNCWALTDWNLSLAPSPFLLKKLNRIWHLPIIISNTRSKHAEMKYARTECRIFALWNIAFMSIAS